MELKDFVGTHEFSGVDYASSSNECDVGINIMFCIDGVTYIAKEDLDDGYRSYMRELEVSDEPCKNTFEPETVECEHVDYSKEYYGYNDILLIKNARTGKTILEIGTENVSDYYPSCIMHYYPENMECNLR